MKIVVATTLPVETGINRAISGREMEAINDFARWRFIEGILHDADGAKLLCWLFELKPETTATAGSSRPYRADAKWWFDLKRKLNLPGYPYEVYTPASYQAQLEKHWPLILFLHGVGECGDRLSDLHNTGMPKWLQHQKEFPFVVVSPQCPWQQDWNPWQLNALLDRVASEYRIDPQRIYLTGLSMGGDGAWMTAAIFPNRFAAVAPIAGSAEKEDIPELKSVPIWAFHGGLDVSVDWDNQSILALRAIGGNVKYTVYPGMHHDVWTKTYSGPELYDWFLEHRLGDGQNH